MASVKTWKTLAKKSKKGLTKRSVSIELTAGSGQATHLRTFERCRRLPAAPLASFDAALPSSRHNFSAPALEGITPIEPAPPSPIFTYMKLIKLGLIVAPGVLLLGCVESHRRPVAVYSPVPPATVVTTPAPTTAPVVVAPTSERPAVRVYPPQTTTVVTTPGAVATVPANEASASDLAIAEQIRHLLATDTSVGSAARDSEITVRDSIVTLRGNAATERARQLLIGSVAAIPGVVRVQDNLQPTLNR
jgi:hypothetical protein